MKGYESRDIKGLKESGAHPEDLNAWEAHTIKLDEARSHQLVIEQNCSFILPVFMSGDAYIRFNRPIGQSIKLMKNVMLKFPISKIYISNAAQAGKEIQLILGTPGFDITPIANVTEITISPDLPEPGMPSPTPDPISYVIPLLPFKSGKIILDLAVERSKTEIDVFGTFFAIFDHGTVGSNWSIWFNTTDNAELTRANLEKFPSGDFWITKLIVSNPPGEGYLEIYLDYIELTDYPPGWPPDEPPDLPDGQDPLPNPVGLPTWVGQNWTLLSTLPVSHSKMVRTNLGYIIAAGSGNVVHRSDDNAVTWTAGANEPNVDCTNIRDILYIPELDRIVVLANGVGGSTSAWGVYYSNNYGDTWTYVGKASQFDQKQIFYCKDESGDHLIYCLMDNAHHPRIYKSTNWGSFSEVYDIKANWTNQSAQFRGSGYFGDGVILISVFQSDETDWCIVKSEDYGATWAIAHTAPSTGTHTGTIHNSMVKMGSKYVFNMRRLTTPNARIYASEDVAETLTAIQYLGGPEDYGGAIIVLGTNTMLAGTGSAAKLYLTQDQAVSFDYVGDITGQTSIQLFMLLSESPFYLIALTNGGKVYKNVEAP